MKVQSLSIVVPNKTCANKCPFCVSRMVNSDIYPNKIDINDPHYDINVSEYLKRLRYVANLGCGTIMLTGTSEPQQNKQFLATFALMHKQIGSPFANIEMQTTGLFLNNNRDYVRFLRNFVGVNTIALSVNSLNDNINNKILGHSSSINDVKLVQLCDILKEYDFNIRICINLTSELNFISTMDVEDAKQKFISYCKQSLNANQITFRKLYASSSITAQSKWIERNSFSKDADLCLRSLLNLYPTIGKTLYGAYIKDCDGLSVIYDDDCMGKNPTKDTLKYLILRPNCKLYSSWDTKASLVF